MKCSTCTNRNICLEEGCDPTRCSGYRKGKNGQAALKRRRRKMSTRCQIGLYERKEADINLPEVLIYRHSDGYPDTECGVVAELTPFLKAFKKERGLNDSAYLGAWMIYHLIGMSCDFQTDPQKYRGLGYGIDFPGLMKIGAKTINGFHGDIEYFYFVAPDVLRVYKVNGWDTEPSSWTLVKEIEIE